MPSSCFTAISVLRRGHRKTHSDVETPKRTFLGLCWCSLRGSVCLVGPGPRLHGHTADTLAQGVLHGFVKDSAYTDNIAYQTEGLEHFLYYVARFGLCWRIVGAALYATGVAASVTQGLHASILLTTTNWS